MFEEINKKLQELQEDIYRGKNIEIMLGNLREQLFDQEKRQTSLEEELNKENLDVEKLNKMTMSAIIYTVLGSKEGKIEKEQQDVLAAQLKLDDINRQVNETKSRISSLQEERTKISNSVERFNELFNRKYEKLKGNDRYKADKIYDLESKIASCKANLKEINEAILAGNSVLSSLDKVGESLDSAEGWGTWDMLGGGFISSMVKHDHIDDARNAASEVQTKLNRFATELTDVNVSSSITIDIGGFAKFADFFFDGFISDWVVQSSIHDSQASVRDVREEVHMVLHKLTNMQDHDKEELSTLEDELSQMILNA